MGHGGGGGNMIVSRGQFATLAGRVLFVDASVGGLDVCRASPY